MVKVTISEFFFFFIYVRGFHERKLTKKYFFQKFYSILILWACKVTLGNNHISKYVLKVNFEIIFWEKPWPPHSYLTITWKCPKINVPKKLSSHVAVKASLKAIPQNHNKTEKIPTLRTSISGFPNPYTGFFGVTVSTHAYLHDQHFISMWQPSPLQEIELECDKKYHLSNGKVLIMVEASSLAEYFLHKNVTYKLLKQNCKTKLCGNACATENIASNSLFVKISLIGCINLYGLKQKYHCFLLKATD